MVCGGGGFFACSAQLKSKKLSFEITAQKNEIEKLKAELNGNTRTRYFQKQLFNLTVKCFSLLQVYIIFSLSASAIFKQEPETATKKSETDITKETPFRSISAILDRCKRPTPFPSSFESKVQKTLSDQCQRQSPFYVRPILGVQRAHPMSNHASFIDEVHEQTGLHANVNNERIANTSNQQQSMHSALFTEPLQSTDSGVQFAQPRNSMMGMVSQRHIH
jgi:hypothetical protein